jgi:hypothetical protein
MSLSRDEFEVLWKVEHSWEHNPQQASNNTEDSVKKFQKIFLSLENQQLLEIHIVNNEIISSEVTDKGHEVLREEQYKEWIDNLKESNVLQQP